jgi:hypothetical protein
MFAHAAARTDRWPPTGPFLEVLQAICRLLARPEYFRLEREFAGPDLHRGKQCTLSRHTHQHRRKRHQARGSDKKERALRRSRGRGGGDRLRADRGRSSQAAQAGATLSGEERERGMIYGAGLDGLGVDPAKICLVVARDEKSLLWAAEEAASCPALAASIITLSRSEKLYGFTESRRLKLRQEKSGVPLFIVRSQPREASAASARWRVAFANSDGLRTPGGAISRLICL